MRVLEEIIKEPNSQVCILHVKEYIHERRQSIYELHKRGASGAHTVLGLTELVDEVLISLFQKTFQNEGLSEEVRRQCCLVAVGGYGRKELAPFSDIDLMFLYNEKVKGDFEKVVKKMLYQLWDLKFTLGNSLRTIDDCIEEAQRDITVKTSLMEARFISGDEFLFRKFREQFFNKVVGRNINKYVQEKIYERKKSFNRYGGTVYLLEPDIKKSKGGLREIHFLQWISLAKHQVCSLTEIQQRGYLSVKEYNILTEARDFLWRIRVESHFFANKSSDILSFEEQQRIAEAFQFEDASHQLGVERFMQQYYLFSTRLHEIGTRFVERVQKKSKIVQKINHFLSRKIDGLFVLSKDEIMVPSLEREQFLGDGKNILKLFYLSKKNQLRISDETLEMVHHGVEIIHESFFNTPEVRSLFKLLMREPRGIAKSLRLMHQISLLEKLIPEFTRVNRLVQFNQYHKYTVDEHSFNCVEKAENLLDESGNLSNIYGQIQRLDILHLSILLHDLGKGLGGDHSEKGALIADSVARRLDYPDEERALLVFLVRFHLLMTHVAFRRDLSDDKVLIQFARKVRKPDILKKLFILTCSDIKGVGPGTWNSWKENLLTELFQKTLEILTGSEPDLSQSQKMERIKEKVISAAATRFSEGWLESQFQDMTERYILVTPVDKILKDLGMLQGLKRGDVKVEVVESDQMKVAEMTIYTFDDIVPGLFSKIAGVLAGKGLQILGAQVHTRKSGKVVDTFSVLDPDYADYPPKERWEDVGKAIEDVLKGKRNIEQIWGKRFSPLNQKFAGVFIEPTQVEVDNESSNHYTIVDIFAVDRPGLLYVITKTLFELGLSIHFSKIATRLDQVVDVFYVQGPLGHKILETQKIQELKNKIVSAVESFKPV